MTSPFPPQLHLSDQLPGENGQEECDSDMSESLSSPLTTAFKKSVDKRDVFLGQRRCVVCGSAAHLQRCRIVGKEDWQNVN